MDSLFGEIAERQIQQLGSHSMFPFAIFSPVSNARNVGIGAAADRLFSNLGDRCQFDAKPGKTALSAMSLSDE